MIKIVATYYQQQKEVWVLIHSLLNQTYKDWNLYICSNGDESVLQLPITDKRIHVEMFAPTGFWGCYNREYMRTRVEDEDYLINCSVEDYYAPTTLEEIAKRNEDFVWFDFSHHHFKYNSSSIESEPSVGAIDWGNFAVKGKVAKQVPIRNCESYTADGEWVEDIMKLKLTKHKIKKILFVKN